MLSSGLNNIFMILSALVGFASLGSTIYTYSKMNKKCVDPKVFKSLKGLTILSVTLVTIVIVYILCVLKCKCLITNERGKKEVLFLLMLLIITFIPCMVLSSSVKNNLKDECESSKDVIISMNIIFYLSMIMVLSLSVVFVVLAKFYQDPDSEKRKLVKQKEKLESVKNKQKEKLEFVKNKQKDEQKQTDEFLEVKKLKDDIKNLKNNIEQEKGKIEKNRNQRKPADKPKSAGDVKVKPKNVGGARSAGEKRNPYVNRQNPEFLNRANYNRRPGVMDNNYFR